MKSKGEVKIEFLHTEECHIWQEGLEVLKNTLKEAGIKAPIEVILIENEEQAREHKFLGSPTILINGIDIEPIARNITRYTLSSCRPYFHRNKSYEYPPRKMILEALEGINEKI